MGCPGVKNSKAPDFIEDFYILSIRVIDYPADILFNNILKVILCKEPVARLQDLQLLYPQT